LSGAQIAKNNFAHSILFNCQGTKTGRSRHDQPPGSVPLNETAAAKDLVV
jgi:hypothetical protein